MPIESITGKPGNAKTAFLVKRIMEDVAKAERPLWAAGIDGFKHEEVGCNVFKDPREWNAVKPGERCTCDDTEDDSTCEAHVIPNGSLIYIDEAWKWFGHLQDASRAPTPAHVLKLAEHRHRGIDFVWTYQQPAQIYPFARGLMAEHRHLVRKFGTMFCDAYDWQELCEDVKSQTKRDGAQKSTVAIPQETFGLYKSAEVHTIKRKLPFKVYMIPLLAIVAIVVAVLAYFALKPSTVAARLGAVEEAPAGTAGAPTSARGRAMEYSTAEEYAAMLAPRVPSAFWTAPAFDGRPVVSDPHVYCMESAAGRGGDGQWLEASVHCVTEQGTAFELDPVMARNVARNGESYNPFKRPERERTMRRDDDKRAGSSGENGEAGP